MVLEILYIFTEEFRENIIFQLIKIKKEKDPITMFRNSS